MQDQSDLVSFLNACVQQLDTRMKDFKLKAEANKKKKGSSKNDSSKRSAEQVDEHIKIVQKLSKVAQKDDYFEEEHVPST